MAEQDRPTKPTLAYPCPCGATATREEKLSPMFGLAMSPVYRITCADCGKATKWYRYWQTALEEWEK